MKTKNLVIIFIVMLIAGISFALNNPFVNMNAHDKIYEDNGKIAESGDSYSYMKKEGTSSNNKSKLEFNLSGMETLWEITTAEETVIDIEFTSDIERGNLKLVIISPDNVVQTIFEQSGSGTESISLEPGQSRIKIVGKSATGTIEFKLFPTDSTTLKAR